MSKGMSEAELRVRLRECLKVFPLRRVADHMRMIASDIRRFAKGLPERQGQGARMSDRRLKKLKRLVLDIETGAVAWNGKLGIKSEVTRQEPTKPPRVVHRVMFDGAAPSLSRGEAQAVETMPSFRQLFADRPTLPFVRKK